MIIEAIKGMLWDVLKGMAWQIFGGINWWLVAAILAATVIVFVVLGKLLGRAGKAALAFGTAFFLFAAGSWMLRPPAPPPTVVRRPIEIKLPELPEITPPDLSGLADTLKDGAASLGRMFDGLGDAFAKLEWPGPDPEEEARRLAAEAERREAEEAALAAEAKRQRRLAQEQARRNRREMARRIGLARAQAMWAGASQYAAQSQMADQMRMQEAMGGFSNLMNRQQQMAAPRPGGY